MKHLRNIFFIFVPAVLGIVTVLFAIHPLLYKEVSGTDSSIDEWLNIFDSWAMIILIASLISALLWYFLAQYAFRVNDWAKAGKRPLWAILMLLPVIIAIIAIMKTPQAEEGIWWVYTFYILSAILPYYLGTVWFSPSSYKYTPVGAQFLRRSW